MGWFQRHLNWTIVLSFFGYCLIVAVIIASVGGQEPILGSGSDLGYVLGIWAVCSAIPSILITIPNAYFVVYFLAPAILFLLACGWVLRSKKRRLAWLFLPALVPLGWTPILFLKNHNLDAAR